MKLSVSNLAWPEEETNWCIEQLVKMGIQGVELAPLKIFGSWEEITDEKVKLVKDRYDGFGVQISSFQAITYGVNDLALLGKKVEVNNFLFHMERVAKLLSNLNGDNAVFGSPGLRKGCAYNLEDLIFLFKRVDSIFAKYKVNFVLETVPKYYGCNLLNTIKQTDTFLSHVNMKNVLRHFDTGCQYLSGDLKEQLQYEDFLSKSAHLHISEIDLNSFDSPSKYNVDITSTIQNSYNGNWCVLEMSDKNYSRESFIKSINNFYRLFSFTN